MNAISFYLPENVNNSFSDLDVFLSVCYLCSPQIAPFLPVLVSVSHIRGFLPMSKNLVTWLIFRSGT